MAVRQQDVSGAMMSILKKMDMMVESTQQTYEESLIVLSSVEAVMKNDVATELKKQTSILMSIETKIGQAQLNETVGGDPARFRDLLGGLSVGLDKIIAATQKLDEKAGEKLNNFFTKLTETLGNFSKQFNAENAKSLTSIIETIGTGVLRFGAVLALYSIIAPFAMIGATLFGLTLRLLIKTTGEIDPNIGKSVVPLLAIGWDILYFGAALALYSIISPLAFIGATMFGLTVRLLQATAGTVDEASLKAMASVKGLAESSLLFGAGMALYSIISPIAMIGAVMFGLTVRLLQKTVGTVDESTMKAMVAVNGLAKSTILFGLSMALYSIISPIAMIGAVMFGLTINLLMKSAGVVDESNVKAMVAINGIAKSTILFGLGMALYAIISPLAIVGATMFGLTVRILMKSAGNVDEQALDSVYLATFIGKNTLLFGLSMALYAVISPLAMVGTVMFGLTVRLLQSTAGTINQESLDSVYLATFIGKNTLLFGLAMALYSVISPLAMVGTVMFGLTVRLLMKSAGIVDEQALDSIYLATLIGKGALFFGIAMAIYSIISPLAMIGTVMFGLTVRLLMKSAGTINEQALDSIYLATLIGKGALFFGIAMALYAVISPLAMVGAVMFGLTVRLLLLSAGTANPQSIEAMNSVLDIAKGALLFGLAMSIYAIISPLAMVGAVMFGLSVRLLLLSAGTANPQSIEAMNSVLTIAKGALLFGLAMVIYAAISPIAMIGAVMFGLSVRLLLLSAGTANPQSIEAMNSVLVLAKGALLFGIAMAIYAVISPLAMVGAVMFGLSVRLLLLSAGTANPQSIEAMNSVLVLAKGALLFGLAMALYAVISPLAMVGAVMFGLSVRLLLLSAGTANPQSIEAMKSVLTLAKGVLLFGIALAIYVVLAPFAMIGAVLFGLTVRLLLMTAGTANQGAIDAMNSVLNLAKGVLLFGFAMVIFTILAPIAMIGAILFGLTIRLLLFAMGTAKKEGTDAMNSVLTLAKGILLFTLAMVVVTLLAPIVLIGALIMTGVLFLLSFALRAMGTKDVKRGVTSLVILGFAIILFGLAILAFNLLVTAQSAIFTLVVVAGFALLLYGIGKFGKELQKGAIALGIMAISIIILGVALMIFKAANLTLLDAVILGAIVVGLGLAMSSFGAEAALIIEGSVAMMAAAIPLILISVALLIFKATKFTAEDGIILGAVVVGLGLAMAAAGVASILIGAGAIAMGLAGVSLIILSVGIGIFKLMDFKKEDATAISSAIDSIATSMTSAGASSILIAVGAIAMGLASVALLPLTASLAIFKASGFTKEDGDNLEYGLSAVINGFLGGRFPGGVVEGLKFAGQAAARAALLTITVPAMIGAGVALIAISKGLAIFKAAGFTKEDGVALESTIGSIAKAFTLVTDKQRQKELGINIDPIDLMVGIMSLSMAGNVLSSLAQGVQAWAKLEVNEYEVIGAGTSKAKLVIKSRRKLNEGDFETAANGMAKVIGAIAEPFALVGRLEKGQPSGNPIYDAIFGGGFVSAGISALKHSGDTIVSLAQGVQAFATMQYTEYEVVNAGTSKAKLVPKGIVKLGEAEISAASKNIAMVIGVVAEAFAKVGKNEANSEGIFSGGFVSKGVKALSGVGDNLKSMVDSVLMMANREIPTFTLINGGTKDAKLVPGNPRKITDPQLFAAADTIMKILKVIANGFYDIGKAESDSSSFWGDGYITKGIKALSGVGDIVAKVTDSVIKIATGTITPMVASGSGTNTKLVPGTPIKITDAMLKSAAKTINSIMMIIGAGIYNVGVFYKKYQDPIDQAIDVLPNMSKSISKLAEGVVSFAELKDIDKSTTNFKSFTGAVFSIFDPAMNKGLPKKLEYMDKFTANIVTMAAPKNQLDKVASNFDKIQKSMQLFKGHVNGMDLVKLTATDSMMKSLAIMSKSPEVVGEKIAESIEKAFKDLLDGIKQINDSSTAAAAAAPTGEAGTPPAGPKKPGAPAGKPTPGAPAGKPGASISAKDIQTAMVSALNSVTINTRVVKY